MYHGLFLINHRVPESQSHISSPWLVGYKLIRGSRMNQPGFHGMSQEFGRSLLSCEKGQIAKHYKLLCLWFVWFILGQHSYWPHVLNPQFCAAYSHRPIFTLHHLFRGGRCEAQRSCYRMVLEKKPHCLDWWVALVKWYLGPSMTQSWEHLPEPQTETLWFLRGSNCSTGNLGRLWWLMWWAVLGIWYIIFGNCCCIFWCITMLYNSNLKEHIFFAWSFYTTLWLWLYIVFYFIHDYI